MLKSLLFGSLEEFPTTATIRKLHDKVLLKNPIFVVSPFPKPFHLVIDIRIQLTNLLFGTISPMLTLNKSFSCIS